MGDGWVFSIPWKSHENPLDLIHRTTTRDPPRRINSTRPARRTLAQPKRCCDLATCHGGIRREQAENQMIIWYKFWSNAHTELAVKGMFFFICFTLFYKPMEILGIGSYCTGFATLLWKWWLGLRVTISGLKNRVNYDEIYADMGNVPGCPEMLIGLFQLQYLSIYLLDPSGTKKTNWIAAWSACLRLLLWGIERRMRMAQRSLVFGQCRPSWIMYLACGAPKKGRTTSWMRIGLPDSIITWTPFFYAKHE